MITVTYKEQAYACTSTIKGPDYIRLLGESGVVVASFEGVANFDAFSIDGGEWTEPTPDHDCYLAIVREDGSVGKSLHKCSDIRRANDHIITQEEREAVYGDIKLSAIGSVCLCAANIEYNAAWYVDRSQITFCFDGFEETTTSAFSLPILAYVTNPVTGSRIRVNGTLYTRKNSRIIYVEIYDIATWIPPKDEQIDMYIYGITFSAVYPLTVWGD